MTYLRQQFSDEQWDLVEAAIQSNAFEKNIEIVRRMGVTILKLAGNEFDGFVDEPVNEILNGTEWGIERATRLAMERKISEEDAMKLLVRAAKLILRITDEGYEDVVPDESNG